MPLMVIFLYLDRFLHPRISLSPAPISQPVITSRTVATRSQSLGRPVTRELVFRSGLGASRTLFREIDLGSVAKLRRSQREKRVALRCSRRGGNSVPK